MAGETGSQFYISLAPTPWLGMWLDDTHLATLICGKYLFKPGSFIDGKHTIFGRISAGMRVIERIGLVPVASDDRPAQDITFYRCYPYKGTVPQLNTKQTTLAVR